MEELVALYGDRWTVELRLRELKTTMKMDVLRCKSVDTVRKEILMHLLAYNLIRALLWQASQAHGRPLHRLSFAGAVQRLDVDGSVPVALCRDPPSDTPLRNPAGMDSP